MGKVLWEVKYRIRGENHMIKLTLGIKLERKVSIVRTVCEVIAVVSA